MSRPKHVKDLAEPEFGRGIKIFVWEHGDIYSKCHEIFINPNHLRTFNSILTYLTNSLCPVFGAIRKLVSIKTKKCINCFKDLEHNGRYIAVGLNKSIKFSAKRFRTCEEIETRMTKKTIKRFYSGDMGEAELRFLCETEKRKLTIIYVLVSGIICQSPFKVVFTGREILAWDVILGYLQNILDVPSGIQHLCTIYGDVILDPSELQHGYVYVAVPYTQKFIQMNYMAFFADWEDNPYKKKGLLSNIRPSSRKFGKDSLCKILGQRLSLGDKESYTVPCDCGPECIEEEEADNYSSCTCLNDDDQPEEENEEYSPDFDECPNTQTFCVNQDSTVIPGSDICIYVNVDENGKYAKICPTFQKTPNVVQCMQVLTSGGPVDKSKRTTDTTQTEACYLDPRNKCNKKLNLCKKHEGETKQNDDNTEHISLSIIVSKTSKMIGTSKMQQNNANITLSKTCEARTVCPNIAVSGSFSKKVGAITEIVNNAIHETYGRLTQTENKYLEGGEAKTKENMSTMDSGDADSTKMNKNKAATRERGHSKDKRNNVVASTGKQQKTQDNNFVGISEKCSFKLKNPGQSIGGKCIRIQNRMYINICDPEKDEDEPKDNKVTYCDKCTSSLHIPKCPCAKKTADIDEYNCVCPPSSPTEDKKTRDPPSSAKNEPKNVNKSVQAPKPTPVRKHSTQKEDSRSSKRTNQVKKQSKDPPKPHTQNATKINSEVHPDTTTDDNKPPRDSISVDSLSGEAKNGVKDDNKIEEVKDDNKTEEVKDDNKNEEVKDEVSITVNMSKVNETEVEETGNEKPNEVISSKIMLDGNFTETYEDVKVILNDVIGATFEKLMLAASSSDVGNGQKRHSVTRSEEVQFVAPVYDKDVVTNPVETKNVSSQKQTDSKDQASKTSFDKMGENQNNVHITVVPPRKCSLLPKCMPMIQVEDLDSCDNYKSKRGTYITTPDNETGILTNVYCLCEPSRQDFTYCTCSKYTTNTQTNEPEREDSCICPKTETKGIGTTEEKGTSKRSKYAANRKNKEIKENTNRTSLQNEKDVKNGRSGKLETAKRMPEKVKKSVQNDISHEPRSKSRANSNGGLKKNERVSSASTRRKNRDSENVSAQKKNENVKSDKSKNASEKSGGFVSQGGESEISVDSIDDNSCCICVCSPNYTL